jgi:hypothetical protein
MDAPTSAYLVQPVVRGRFAEDVINILGVGAGIMWSTSCRFENTERKVHVVSNFTFVADRSQSESLTFDDVQSTNDVIEVSGPRH